MQRKQVTTFAAVYNQAPGDKENPSWVNGEFDAILLESKPGQTGAGKAFTRLNLANPENQAEQLSMIMWSQVSIQPGSMVRIGGSGCQRTVYVGKDGRATQQLSAGRSTTIHPIGAQFAPQPAPQGGTFTEVPNQTIPHAARPAPSSGPIHGATVGMAINQAVGIINKFEFGLDYFNSRDFTGDLWDIASHIIRVSQHLEKGNLADKAGERVPMGDRPPARTAPPHAPNEAAFYTPPPFTSLHGDQNTALEPVKQRPQPGPDGTVQVDFNYDEDCPF